VDRGGKSCGLNVLLYIIGGEVGGWVDGWDVHLVAGLDALARAHLVLPLAGQHLFSVRGWVDEGEKDCSVSSEVWSTLRRWVVGGWMDGWVDMCVVQ